MAITIIPNYQQPHKGILQEPHPSLRAVSKPVGAIDNQVKTIATKLLKTLEQVDKPYKRWLGMAAPQLGYSIRVIAVKIGSNKYLVMVNPEIVGQRLQLPGLAGCFSLKGLYILKRYYWLRVKYKDI